MDRPPGETMWTDHLDRTAHLHSASHVSGQQRVPVHLPNPGHSIGVVVYAHAVSPQHSLSLRLAVNGHDGRQLDCGVAHSLHDSSQQPADAHHIGAVLKLKSNAQAHQNKLTKFLIIKQK